MENLRHSALLIISAEEPEVDSGSAALAGMAYCLAIPVIMYYSGSLRSVGSSGQVMLKNLMLDQSSAKICRSLAEIPDAAAQVLNTGA